MIVTRFAPSPTGYLHVGHAFAALTARASGEKFCLRMEDIDTARSKPIFEAAILNDLAWLGLKWDGPVVRQSERLEIYRAALDHLRMHEVLYPCFCTRKEIALEVEDAANAPHQQATAVYPGTCRKLSQRLQEEKVAQGQPYAWRLDVEKGAALAGPLTFQEKNCGPEGEHGIIEVNPIGAGDIVLARKGMLASYHLAVTIDDAYQGVTLVTRGNDLFQATHIQRLLQALLELPTPHYAHHRLILDEDGRKFSKRDNAVTLRSLRDRRVSVDDLRRWLDSSLH